MYQFCLSNRWSITESNSADSQFRCKISKWLDDFNVEQTGIPDNQPLDLYLHDQVGEVNGGLVGRTSLGVLFINFFFIPESARRRGIGSELLKRAEEEARRRGCHVAMLFTMSIQAPEFYLKHGYTIFGEVPCMPSGNSRIFMRKAL
ncbi:Similar to acetyltransferase [Xenorhabdus poinarii G6]|uniref:Similar to acetyltransferase n=1 Tax=Xenorhabdus poinarii G6 TaxID=1354304 RepID=A0A068R298_9GAMM|nr:GNAT family N-acetyltransferase [Xenorhabdus poinarii]CDG21412.1 Similar to acetyltransferase [Xenorhabdus poinarii G6]